MQSLRRLSARLHASTCTATGAESRRQAGQTQRLLLRACPHRRRLVARCSEPGSGGVGVTVRPACHPRPPSVMLRPPALEPSACGATFVRQLSIVLADCSAGKGSPGHVAGCCILLLVGQRSGVRRGGWLRCRCAVSSANSPEVRSGTASVRASEQRALTRIGQGGPFTKSRLL